MYSIILCAVGSLIISLGGYFLGGWGWVWAIIITMVLFAVSWVFLNRRFSNLLHPKMELIRKLVEGQQLDQARLVLTETLAMAPWVPMLRGQIESQLGVLAIHSGDDKSAIEHLSNSSRRVAEGQLMLAALHYRRKEPDQAIQVLAAALPFHRKHSLLQNVYAYFLQKEGRVDEAIAQLNLLVKKLPEDDIGKDNLLRLKNGKRMDLKGFGNEWYALGLERPPTSMGMLRTARPGFREPPKKTGTKRKKKPRRR